MLKLVFISLGLIVAFALGYILANSQATAAHLSTVEVMLQESPLSSPEAISTPDSSPSPVAQLSVDVSILEQIFRDVVGEEIDISELGQVIELGEHSVLTIGYILDGSESIAIFSNLFPWRNPEESWHLLAVTSWGHWDFTPHVTRSWQGRRDLENESAIMRFYSPFDWGGYPQVEWNTVAEYVEVEVRGENFSEQLISLMRQHIAWHDWEGNRREISIRDMWFIENRLIIDFDNISIWDNQGTSGEFAVTMSLFRTLASLLDTEDVAQVVFLYNGIEDFEVGGHGGRMGRLHLNNEDTLRWLGLVLDQ